MVLTADQLREFRRGQPVKVPLPELGEEVVLLRVAAFETIRELLAEEEERRQISAMACRNALKRELAEP